MAAATLRHRLHRIPAREARHFLRLVFPQKLSIDWRVQERAREVNGHPEIGSTKVAGHGEVHADDAAIGAEFRAAGKQSTRYEATNSVVSENYVA